jgi:hypothetical protein
MAGHFQTIDEIEAAMAKSVHQAQLAKAQGQPVEELQHQATAYRLADLRNAVDAYGIEILFSDEEVN